MSVIKGAAAVTAGVIVIACMPAAAPALLQTVVSTVSLTSAGMGLYDVSEGVQDVYYGLSGDANSQSVHPIKDYYFHGNQAAYNKAEMMLQVGTALGGLGTLAFSPTITAGNVANYANMMEQGLDFFDAVEESSGNTGNRSETVATVEELMQMMNQRDRVTARFAVGDELEYLISQEAEASHMLMEDGSSDLIFRKDSSTRWTLFHEWSHRYLQNKNGSYMPGEDNYIEDFLERHKEFF